MSNNPFLTIRHWLIIFPLIGLSCASYANTQHTTSKETISIQLKRQHSFQFAGYYAAVEKGFYRDAGLKVELKELDSSRDLVQQVLNNDSEYGISDASLVIYRLRGQPVVLINQIFQHSSLVFLSHHDSGIISPYEMIGKRVIYNHENQSLGSAPLTALLLTTLHDNTKIKLEQSSNQSRQDFVEGKIDVISAYSTSEPFLFREQGLNVNIIDPQNYGIHFYGDNLFTSEKELRDHPERVRKISQATLKGWQYALDHSDEIIDRIIKKYNPGLSKALLQYEARTIRHVILPDLIELGSVDPQRFQKSVEVYRRLGMTREKRVDSRFFYRNHTHHFSLTAKERLWIKEHPIINVGVEKNWGPFSFENSSGEYSGLCRDYIELIAKKTGLTFKPRFGNWNEIETQIKNKEVDLIPTAYLDPHISENINFSKQYISLLDYFFIRDDLKAKSVDDINGYTVAIPKGYLEIRIIKKQLPHLKVLETNDLSTAINAVLEHKADLLFESYAVLSHQLRKRAIGNIIPFKEPPWKKASGLHIATRKDTPELSSIIQKTLSALSYSEKEHIYNKWIKSPGKKENKIDLSIDERKWLKDHPVIRFSGDPNWLPYEAFDKKGKYIGIVAEHLKLIEQMLGIELTIIPTKSWSESVNKVRKGEIDVLSETIDSELTSHLQFTRPYLSSPIVIVMRNDEDYVENINQIKHKKLAVIKNYGYVPEIIRHYPEINFRRVDAIQDGLTAISTGKVDALLATLAQASYHIREMGINNIQILGKTEFSTQLAFGMNEEFAPLVPLFNRALNEITHSKKQDILKLWGKNEYAEKINYTLLYQTAGILSLILIGSLFWNRRLHLEIEKRKISEKKISLLNKRLELASQVVSLGVLERDMDNENILIFDNRMREIYGLAKNARVSFEEWMAMIHPDDHSIINDSVDRLCQQGGQEHIEFRIIRADGDLRHIYTGLTIDRNGYGQPTKLFGVSRDISKQKMAEKTLKQAKQEAEHANNVKSEFLANMSHEIRTPLNAIIGFTELLNEQTKEPCLKTFVKTIQSAGNSLLTLINDILDLSKIEAGKFEIEKTATNPHEMFTELGNIFRVNIRKKGLELILEIDSNIPESLMLDATRLRQVLFNIVGNAVKFTKRGYIRLTASTENENIKRSKLDLLINIEDSGIGIPQHNLEKIFNKFEQVGGQEPKKLGGTGLGLSISRRLTELMGGTITVRSQLNQGTTFSIHLKDIDIASVQAEPLSTNNTFDVHSFRFKPAVLLVVDDIADNRRLVIENISGTELTVIEAKNGEQAVNIAREKSIDLILLDLRMPIMDGYQAAGIIKSFLDVPIIALTASVMKDKHERIKNEHFDGYLRKPVLRSDLFKELSRFLVYDSVTQSNTEKENITFTEKQLAVLPEVLNQLEEKVHQRELILKNNSISSMKEFADAIALLGKRNGIPVLSEYASSFNECIDAFDIIGMKHYLSEYTDLYENLKSRSDIPITDKFSQK